MTHAAELTHSALIDAEGCVLQSWPTDRAPDPLPEGEIVAISPWCDHTLIRWDGEVWVPRATCVVEAVPTGAEVTAPEGTIIEVWDLEADYLLATLSPSEDEDYRVSIELSDLGRYAIEVQPPSPWLRSRLIVEII
ncbi:hypothetical protein CDV50_15970 [Haematobacter massiliensis]|uniref:hypothetical protein n=1 Tax=Haematobacter massiliensis TaxID=195105 RepID=UPI000B4A417E|nr:hypothetical protein [Haematobacter massiliensis]OWJ69817.1 hypothetical protein CDV50_15970 [Haematobacter massiliensis]